MPERDEYVEEIREMWDTHWLTNMGVKHKQLESDLADYLGINKDNITLFVNGHLALECIIEALGLGNELNEKGEYIHFAFGKDALLPEYVQYIIRHHSKDCVISAMGKPTIKYRYKNKKEMLSNIKFILQRLNELHNENL